MSRSKLHWPLLEHENTHHNEIYDHILETEKYQTDNIWVVGKGKKV